MIIKSLNVNGLRAAIKKGFVNYVNKPLDILLLQEIKLDETAIPNEINNLKLNKYWAFANKKGYSGTAVFTKNKPVEVTNKIGLKEFDAEGRYLELKFKNFTLINAYYPHTRRDLSRMDYKLAFNKAILDKMLKLKNEGGNIILGGDLNVAHQEIDLARPKGNTKNAGFTNIERDGFSEYLKKGLIDTYRHFYPTKEEMYTWWSNRGGCRERNVGWRIDYFVVNKEFMPSIKKADIETNVVLSDHCPISIELKI